MMMVSQTGAKHHTSLPLRPPAPALEGTLVLEQLAAIGRVDDFFDAIDSDDIDRATALMKKAKIHRRTIATVVE